MPFNRCYYCFFLLLVNWSLFPKKIFLFAETLIRHYISITIWWNINGKTELNWTVCKTVEMILMLALRKNSQPHCTNYIQRMWQGHSEKIDLSSLQLFVAHKHIDKSIFIYLYLYFNRTFIFVCWIFFSFKYILLCIYYMNELCVINIKHHKKYTNTEAKKNRDFLNFLDLTNENLPDWML